MDRSESNLVSGRQLRAARVLTGLTQVQLSKEAGFNPRALPILGRPRCESANHQPAIPLRNRACAPASRCRGFLSADAGLPPDLNEIGHEGIMFFWCNWII